MNKSIGDFILFLDADDLLEKNKLKSHVEALISNSETDIAYGDVRYFYDNDKSKLYFSLKKDNKPWATKFSGRGKDMVDILLRKNLMVTSSPLFRKKVLERTGGFDSRLYKLEDWELFQRMAINDLKFQFINTSHSLVLMRAHASSFSYDQKGMRSYLLPVLEKHLMCSKISFKNKLYACIRMIEEYTDVKLHYLFSRNYPPIHYYKYYKYILPFLSLLFLPFYLIVKLIRLYRNNG
jgi:hypothetical protein